VYLSKGSLATCRCSACGTCMFVTVRVCDTGVFVTVNVEEVNPYVYRYHG